LVIGTKEAPPFAMKTIDDTWQGISIDLWRMIADQLHLHYRFAEAPDVQSLIAGVAAKVPRKSRRATCRPLVHPDARVMALRQTDRASRFCPTSSSPAPRLNPHSARRTAAEPPTTISSSALFRRRPPARGDDPRLPASEHLHRLGLPRTSVSCRQVPGGWLNAESKSGPVRPTHWRE
jgi:hypothetical protein